MDDEHTEGYRDPCTQCSAVDWGVSDEGRFYCRSCHNVIERTKEVLDPSFMPGSSRVTTIGKRGRTRRTEAGRQWMICEGFQFILRNQANALIHLGVHPQFKEQVLCQLWRLYLQKTRQAYTHDPVRSSQLKVRGLDSESDSAADMSASEIDGDSDPPSSIRSGTGSSSEQSLRSGPVDNDRYMSGRQKRTRAPMNMRRTLALIHLALVWSREALTLSDLLRLVDEGHVPYVNAHQDLPDEMKLQGKDALVFRVESVPSHRALHKEAQSLILLLQLPAFPPISRQSLLHPVLLSLRYLSDANLPDELHLWVCRLMEHAHMDGEDLYTCDGSPRATLPRHDVQTAALIIVTMKLMFGLDDRGEWDLSNRSCCQDQSGELFSLRRWFKLLQSALIRAQQRKRQNAARKQWKSRNPVCVSREERMVLMKRKRVTEQVRGCFEKLSSLPAGVERVGPSGFRFCWGDEDGWDGPSLQQKKLDGVVTLKNKVLTPCSSTYWHPALKRCRTRFCSGHYSEMEPTLPRTFVWLLQLFGFLLDAKPADLYEEVLLVERRVFSRRRKRTGAQRR